MVRDTRDLDTDACDPGREDPPRWNSLIERRILLLRAGMDPAFSKRITRDNHEIIPYRKGFTQENGHRKRGDGLRLGAIQLQSGRKPCFEPRSYTGEKDFRGPTGGSRLGKRRACENGG